MAASLVLCLMPFDVLLILTEPEAVPQRLFGWTMTPIAST